MLAAVEPDKGRESDAGEGALVDGDAARLRKRKKDPRRPSQVMHPCELEYGFGGVMSQSALCLCWRASPQPRLMS